MLLIINKYLYYIVKIWIRLGLLFFCRKISFSDRAVLRSKGPLLLACNHPNSFLDAIIVGSHFNRPVHFLARGDVFRKPLAKKILSALKLIPIYRLSEGREYLALNDATFERCGEILRQGGIVLIFAEGLCVNQWELRPLKKGAARIAWTAFNDPIIGQLFRVIPVGINYNGFSQASKRVIVQFEKTITASHFPAIQTSGDFIQHFNDLLKISLENAMLCDRGAGKIIPLLISNYSDANENPNIIAVLKKQQQFITHNNLSPVLQLLKSPSLIACTKIEFAGNVIAFIILIIPAIGGRLLHFLLLYLLKKTIRKKTDGTVFYDSVLFGMLLLLYPAYWMLINILTALFIPAMLIRVVGSASPLFAFIYLIWSDCYQKIVNYSKLSTSQRKLIANTIF